MRLIKYPINEARIIHSLDKPIEGREAVEGILSVKGWVYPRSDGPLKVIIENSHGVFEFLPNRDRPDVLRHLLKKYGVETNRKVGFEFDLPIGSGFDVSYDVDEMRVPFLKVEGVRENPFPEIGGWEDLLESKFGVLGNYYFRNGFDWRRVLIFFNGRVTEDKISMDRSIFQRWSWARYFRHPVICISDPLTVGNGAVSIAWYLGKDEGEMVSSLVVPAIEAVRRKCPGAKIITFGSSGGGFAALLCAQLGFADEAIAINPQTDALLYDDRNAVAEFVSLRKKNLDQTNLFFYGLERMKSDSMVTYIQNDADVSHLNDHMIPYRKFVASSGRLRNFKFVNFVDEKIGHAPPDFYGIKRIMGGDWERFCV
ncbi:MULTISPECIES: hypothetical protein [unclassified Burkholderia]|uniref:hypothetical protein n=1 Tax=unclassified Burkholderia TaxID=2613784 RepID=UPI000F56FEFE|nr:MULTISPECIES: hypothetical protein [unclassified Burkholderia]